MSNYGNGISGFVGIAKINPNNSDLDMVRSAERAYNKANKIWLEACQSKLFPGESPG